MRQSKRDNRICGQLHTSTSTPSPPPPHKRCACVAFHRPYTLFSLSLSVARAHFNSFILYFHLSVAVYTRSVCMLVILLSNSGKKKNSLSALYVCSILFFPNHLLLLLLLLLQTTDNKNKPEIESEELGIEEKKNLK